MININIKSNQIKSYIKKDKDRATAGKKSLVLISSNKQKRKKMLEGVKTIFNPLYLYLPINHHNIGNIFDSFFFCFLFIFVIIICYLFFFFDFMNRNIR